MQVNPFVNKKTNNKPIKKDFFKESNIFKTPIISNPKALYNLGYFYGISSVDLNNDHISDIILPGDFFIDVIIKNKNKYEANTNH